MTGKTNKEFGARRKLTDDELDQLRRLAGLLNVDQVADYFAISRDNFSLMRKEDPEIMQKRMEFDADLQLRREKQQADIALEREKLEAELALKQQEMAVELELRRAKLAMGDTGVSTNIPGAV